ncbi:MAG: hypothetical protein M3119_09300 [Verrucomicrobiota bacterium]|nr:hypothetical protein [Verrucomicrobiota bacterium]
MPLFILHQNEMRDLGTKSSFSFIAETLANFFKCTFRP